MRLRDLDTVSLGRGSSVKLFTFGSTLQAAGGQAGEEVT